MYGAIIGDLSGSIYEFDEFNDNQQRIINVERRKNILNSEFKIPENAFFSDDTILTIAILEASLKNIDYGDTLKKYGRNYYNKVPADNYFKYMFSPGFIKWFNQDEIGTSIGNGAAMRISPIGYLYNDLDTIKKKVIEATTPSHNSKSAIDGALAVASVILLARQNKSKEEISTYLINNFNYNLNYNLDELINTNTFKSTCQETIPLCLYLILNATSFTDAIKKAIAIGGDTDTNACIVGSMAEALYGIPKEIINDMKKYIPIEFLQLLNKGYKVNYKLKR